MKKLLLLLLITPSFIFADARKYNYPDPNLNAEIDSIYHDLLYLKSVNITASTETVTQLNVSTVVITGRATVRNGISSTDVVALGQLKVFQVVTSSDTQSTSTTSSSYQNTTLSATITPTDSSHKIIILVSGELHNSTILNADVGATVYRNAVNIMTDVCVIGSGSAASSLNAPCSMSVWDLPATTSATTYSVRIRIEAGTGTVIWNRQSQTTMMTLLEVS